MKCPYQRKNDGTFLDCTVECPACIYEVHEHEKLVGKYGATLGSIEFGLRNGLCWYTTQKEYTITGCKFAENLVRPTDQTITNVTNVQKNEMSVMLHQSIF